MKILKSQKMGLLEWVVKSLFNSSNEQQLGIGMDGKCAFYKPGNLQKLIHYDLSR